MCLRTVDSVAAGYSKKATVGYKVMLKRNRNADWFGDDIPKDWTYRSAIIGKFYVTEVWYTSQDSRKLVYWPDYPSGPISNSKEYTLGFHIYPTLEDARRGCFDTTHCIVQVIYYGVLARGTEGTYNRKRDVVVARHMKITGYVANDYSKT